MKSDDLFTKLHDQYNTIPSAILDSEAFHHDVLEISTEASTSDEFHRLMAQRKQQRLNELNEGLESAAVEIIANPALIGTPQWEYALQLFRARSLDALVSYFSSYLPDHPLHAGGYATDGSSRDSHSIRSASSKSSATSASTHVDTGDFPSFFPHDDEKPLVTHEPFSISTVVATHLPPSPRSVDAESPVASHSDDEDADPDPYVINTLTPARSLSFSGSESDRFFGPGPSGHFDEDDASQSLDPETPSTSVSDEPDVDDLNEASDPHLQSVVDSHEREARSDSSPFTVSEPDSTAEPTVTLPCHASESLLSELSPSMISRIRRLPSPPNTQPHHDAARKSPRLCRRELSPGRTIRRSPGASLGRVQKPAMEQARLRAVSRKRPD